MAIDLFSLSKIHLLQFSSFLISELWIIDFELLLGCWEMASCLKPICKLCGSMVKRVRKRKRKPSKCFEELANKDFDHYEVIDNYYYKLVDNSPRTVSSWFCVVLFRVMMSLVDSYPSYAPAVLISHKLWYEKRCFGLESVYGSGLHFQHGEIFFRLFIVIL